MSSISLEQLDPILDAAVRSIPPAWPLAATVAVNPFLGQSGETLVQTAARLGRVAGVAVTMPRAHYAQLIKEGRIRDEDIAFALIPEGATDLKLTVPAIRAAASKEAPAPEALATMAELAGKVSGIDWPGILAERFGAWAAGYFDEGQALWAAPKERGAYSAWRAAAMHDLTPEILGLKGFARHVAEAPQRPQEAIMRVVRRLGLSEAALPTYFHSLLMSLGGWAQIARQRLWQAELEGGSDSTARQLLAIRLVWEEALHGLYRPEVEEEWAAVREAHEAPLEPSDAQLIDSILQTAAERAEQRDLARLFGQQVTLKRPERPALQAAFCIDVRSEVFRRALESLDPAIQSLGFAGFFGLGTAHRRFASDVVERRLPVLLSPTLRSASGAEDQIDQDLSTRFSARATRAWGRFKLAAVSSFAFVEAAGPIYVGRLFRDSLGLRRGTKQEDPAPRLETSLTLEERIGAAATILKAMSLTKDFARVVLIAGHGGKVVNNPHASALHCGACGGYSGEANARLLALLLNDPEVRGGLAGQGIAVPEDTLFLAALHDTTGDLVTLYREDVDCRNHELDLGKIESWLASAGRIARSERLLTLPRAKRQQDIALRSRDWAETRPEWALAGCKAFIAAPRSRTQGRSLGGRAFLHDYDWQADEGFKILELIMTAPVVVASWISLQYYGSSVAPEAFGGGNKLLHNVVGGIGVQEGNGGLLRTGLPWQSVHDGAALYHKPLRLSVCIEAPRAAMTEILQNHPEVRKLFDKGWLSLFQLDEAGQMTWRYAGDLEWEESALETPGLLQAAA